MNIKELDKMINEILIQEARKLIKEQVTEVDHVLDAIKGFQSLSKLQSKISGIEDAGNENLKTILINVQGIKPEELVQCCGGNSLQESLKNLMQGLHHDLENNGIGKDLDVDIDTSGDENSLNLVIRIMSNNDKLLGDMDENIKDTNPTADDEKNVILGGEENGTQNNQNEVNENKNLKKMGKKIITLTEAGMTELLTKIITEAASPKIFDATTAKVLKDSESQNSDALKAVEKKIKDYLSFKGNDNPEFPNQIGMGDEKAARVATNDEEDFIDDNRGRGPQDLDYQNEPSKEFKERVKKSLIGSSEMGNPADAANAIKTDVGKNMHKKIEKRQKIHRKEPIYAKEPVPVETKPKEDEMRPIQEEIERMKQMSSYNEKTQ